MRAAVDRVEPDGGAAAEPGSSGGGRVLLNAVSPEPAAGVARAPPPSMDALPYDWLVLALGAEPRMDMAEGARQFAMPFSTLADVEVRGGPLLDRGGRLPSDVHVLSHWRR